MSVSDVFLDAEIKYISIISLSPTPFALHQTVKAEAYISESLGACRRWSGHVTSSHVPCVWLTVLCRQLARLQCVTVSEKHSVCSTINIPRNCVNPTDTFRYICSEMTFKSRRRSFTPLIKKGYEHYFGCKVGDQDKSWAPHFCWVTCVRLLAALCLWPIVWFEESPRTMLQIATSAWPVSLM